MPPSRRSASRFRPSLLTLETRDLPALTVTTLLDSGAGSLRAQLAAAAPGETIDFAPSVRGTITLASELRLTKNVTLSGPGASALALSGNDATRVLRVNPGVTAALSGLTVSHGRVTAFGSSGEQVAEGGGVYNEGTLTLADCTVADNALVADSTGLHATTQGAGLWNSGRLTLTGCTVRNNTGTSSATGSTYANGRGGGIFDYGTLTLTNTTVADNRITATCSDPRIGVAATAGGVCTLVTAILTGCTLSNNSVLGTGTGGASSFCDGGGIYGAALTVRDSVIRDNTASAVTTGTGQSDCYAGGARIGGPVSLTNCTLTGNRCEAQSVGQATATGGGVGGQGDSVTLAGCTAFGNTAEATSTAGGAFATGGGVGNTGTVTLTTCTVAGNTARATGANPLSLAQAGGVFTGFTGTLTACTIAGNVAVGPTSRGGGVDRVGLPAVGNSLIAGNTAAQAPDINGAASRGYNLIGIASSAGWAGTDQTGTIASPLDPLLAPLADYGGLTRTIALRTGSPALNAGDPALLGTADQRGVVRGGSVNVGAFQASADHFVLSAPASVTAGDSFAATATAYDILGQVAVGYTGTVYLNSTDPQNPNLDSHGFVLADGGSFPFTGEQLFTAGPQTLTLGDGLIGDTLELAVVPGAAAALALGTLDNPMAGVSFTVFVVAFDAYGNLATGYTGTVHFGSTDPAAGLPDDYTFGSTDQGIAVFTLTLNTPGTVRLTVADAAGNLSAFLDVVVS